LAWTLRLSETAKRQLRKLDAGSAQAILRYLNRLLLETSDPRERGSGHAVEIACSRKALPDEALVRVLADSTVNLPELLFASSAGGATTTKARSPMASPRASASQHSWYMRRRR
jgi:hypothetical protein